MRVSERVSRLTAQLALLVTLASVSGYLLTSTYLGDEEHNYKEGAVTEMVEGGTLTLENVKWQVDSVQPHTQLVDDRRRKVALEGNVAGSVVVVVKLTITPLDGVRLDSGGFQCDATLRDDRGNVWKSQDVFSYSPPTNCSDDDHPFKHNRPGKVAKVFVVPASAVPHLVGIQVESFDDYRRVLLRF